MLSLVPDRVVSSILDPRGGSGPFEVTLTGLYDMGGELTVRARHFEGTENGARFIKADLEFRRDGGTSTIRLHLLPTQKIEIID